MTADQPFAALVLVVSIDPATGHDSAVACVYDTRTGVFTLAPVPAGHRISITTAYPSFTEPTLALIKPRKPARPPALARPRREWWNRR